MDVIVIWAAERGGVGVRPRQRRIITAALSLYPRTIRQHDRECPGGNERATGRPLLWYPMMMLSYGPPWSAMNGASEAGRLADYLVFLPSTQAILLTLVGVRVS